MSICQKFGRPGQNEGENLNHRPIGGTIAGLSFMIFATAVTFIPELDFLFFFVKKILMVAAMAHVCLFDNNHPVTWR